ncbi:MAG: hypothetical protein KAJ34_07890 [Thermodesulfovibrionia bacterium]|nr:hypothetical protein [Thermodesulfovibrionia bacterium]
MKRILFMVLCFMVISGLFLVSCKKQETPKTEETVTETETEGYGEKAKEAEKEKEAVSGYGEKEKEAVEQ